MDTYREYQDLDLDLDLDIENRSRSRSSSLSNSSNKSELRTQLYSVAWVQCDNADCLKWRKIPQKVADEIGKDDTWTCPMNKDTNFQSCSVPEEDTAAFDRLAKRAKLDLIKSELAAGTLVWARVDGYCRWPALITPDPLCDKHADGDEEEILWYHVEFLGGERSHGWLRSNRIEVFGSGNSDILERESQNLSAPKVPAKKRKGRRKGKLRLNGGQKVNLKRTYKGNFTVQSAISEALTLLKESVVDRLQTCWFVAESITSATKRITSVAGTKRGESSKSKTSNERMKSANKTEQISPRLRSTNEKSQGVNELYCNSTNERPKPLKRGRPKKYNSNFPARQTKEVEGKELKNLNTFCKPVDNGCVKNVNRDTIKLPKGLRCLEFPSSLLGSSKEDRLLLDIQMYMKNEKAFEEDVKQFMSSQGLNVSPSPVWHSVKVSIFSIFLAVYERGGFEMVCDNFLWGCVYSEVSHQQTTRGNSVVKKFYRRNLYAYELYVTGQDYSLAVKALKQELKMKSNYDIEGSLGHSNNDCTSSPDCDKPLQTASVEENNDKQDLHGHIDTLDEILLILEGKKNNMDRNVPQTGLPDLSEISNNRRESQVDTASVRGIAFEPEEKAQVVPDLDFPSSIESSQSSNDLHEMQAVQLHMGEINNQVNFL